jgi:hypothetical protein
MNITEPVGAINTRSRSYPNLPNQLTGWTWFDEFERTDLNPTDIMVMYSTNVSNSGTVAITLGTILRLTTDAAIGDHASCFTSGLTIKVPAQNAMLEARSKYILDITFKNPDITDQEGFIGVTDGTSALTAIPTTDNHLGITWDLSASPNYFITHSDGVTHTTVDTGIAVNSSANHAIRIENNNSDDVTIKYFDDITNDTPSSTVTGIDYSQNKSIIHFIVLTEELATNRLDIHDIKVAWN